MKGEARQEEDEDGVPRDGPEIIERVQPGIEKVIDVGYLHQDRVDRGEELNLTRTVLVQGQHTLRENILETLRQIAEHRSGEAKVMKVYLICRTQAQTNHDREQRE